MTPPDLTGPIPDLFAGPGGWDEGAKMLGITSTYGLESEKNACATAEAAGHARMLGDLSAVDPLEYAPAWGLIASPPCQAWSRAGKQLGYKDRDACFDLVDAYAAGKDRASVVHDWHDPRSHLVAEPMRWINALRPEWVALEEVGAVMDLWARYAEHLERMGYTTWHGILNAADYGVPQTRKRAVLIASRTRKVTRPQPTHHKDEVLGIGRWVSMAEALGWDGLVGFPRRSDGQAEVVIGGTAYRARDLNATEQPAQTVTEKARSWQVLPGAMRGSGNVGGSADRPITDPAPTLTGKGTAVWCYDRPATTVVGSFRPDIIAAPGWRKPGDGPRQNAPGSVRVDVHEAGVLQSFRPDYPWTGAKTRQFQQVGNAVPPRLAAHVLAEAIGLDPTDGIARYYEEARRAATA